MSTVKEPTLRSTCVRDAFGTLVHFVKVNGHKFSFISQFQLHHHHEAGPHRATDAAEARFLIIY